MFMRKCLILLIIIEKIIKDTYEAQVIARGLEDVELGKVAKADVVFDDLKRIYGF